MTVKGHVHFILCPALNCANTDTETCGPRNVVRIAHKYHSGISFTNLATIRVLVESEPMRRTNVHILLWLNIPTQCQEIRIRTNTVFTDLTQTYRQEFEPSNLFAEQTSRNARLRLQCLSGLMTSSLSAQNIPHLKI